MRQLLTAALALVITGCSSVYRPIQFGPPPESVQLPLLALPEATTLRLVAVGDTGDDTSNVALGIAELHARRPIDAILLLGDNIYPCGVSSESDPLWSRAGPLRIGVPIYPVLGNHDYGNPVGVLGATAACGNPSPNAQLEKSGSWPDWRFPSRNYRLAGRDVEIFMIDTTPIARGWTRSFRGSSPAAEIKQRLAEALAVSNAGWKVVVGHHMIYSSGEHGRPENFERRNMRTLLPILERGGADLYICGHDHDLEVIGRDHQPQFIISGAGSRLRGIGRRDSAEPPTLFPQIPSAPFMGFMVLEIDVPGGKATVEVFDADGKAVEGAKFVNSGATPISAGTPR